MDDIADEAGLCRSHLQLVYKLVRVEGDGTFVPATDDEVMEVEVEHMRKDEKYLPLTNSLEQSQDSNIRSHEGISQSNSDGYPGNLNAKLEFIEVMLQKVKREETLRLLREAPICAPKCDNQEGQPFYQQAYLPSSNNAALTESPSQEDGVTFVSVEPVGSVGQCTDFTKNDQTSSRALVPSIYSNFSQISILEGGICLDNLTIRELQETFRLAVGRPTSVKDKIWLKRQIAMVLNNSCIAPSTDIIIKGRNISLQNVKGSQCSPEGTKNEVLSPSAIQNIGPVNDSIQDLQFTSHVGLSISGKRLRTSVPSFVSESVKSCTETVRTKRVRKPTKRYIEELSKVETRECCVKPVTPDKSSGQAQFSAKCRFRPTTGISSQHTEFITRTDFLGGYGIQVPYVVRVRRGRPRTNILTLMNAALVQREKTTAAVCRKEKACADYLDDYSDIVLRPKCGTRRKHHRAWTLHEVVKLVEGVSRYGAGRWSEIKRFAFPSYSCRTSVDLKDKWRNLMRVCFTRSSTERGVCNSARRASGLIPTSILLRVKELAEVQSQGRIGLL